MAVNGVHPPPYVISEDDKRGIVVVVTATTLSFVWTCLCIRVWLRFKPREWRADDYFLAVSTVLDTILACLIFRIVGKGLGRTTEDLNGFQDLKEIGKHDFVIQIIYIFTLLLSKCAVLFLYLRLSPRREHIITSWATMALSIVWGLVAIIMVSVSCRPAEYWPNGLEKCSGMRQRWRAIAALDVFTEFAIFLISIYLVGKLNMKTRSKILVVAAFSLRLPVIAASLTRLYYLEFVFTPPNFDRSLLGTYYIICTQVHLSYSVMSFTLTGMGPFLRPFTTTSSHHSSTMPSHISKNHHSADEDHESSYSPDRTTAYQMAPLPSPKLPKERSAKGKDKKKGNCAHSTSRSSGELNLRPEKDLVKQDTAVLGGGDMYDERDSALSRVSDDSQRMIITKRTEFTVEMDRASLPNNIGWRLNKGAIGD